MVLILCIVLLLLLCGAGGYYGFNRGGYRPAPHVYGGGLIGVILIVLLVLWLFRLI